MQVPSPVLCVVMFCLRNSRSLASLAFRLFSINMLKVYRKGLSAELRGSTKMAMATLTSPGTGVPLLAIRPSTPMGNQHRKSDTTTVIKRRAIIRSRDVVLELVDSIELDVIDQYIETWTNAIDRNKIKLNTIMTPNEYP